MHENAGLQMFSLVPRSFINISPLNSLSTRLADVMQSHLLNLLLKSLHKKSNYRIASYFGGH